jgi:hypothetical protein
MGSGRWDNVGYSSARALRSSTAKKSGLAVEDVDFAYDRRAKQDSSLGVHPSLDPKRINKKPFKKLESRDSVEHPESNAVLVVTDVTGSNKANAIESQKRLPNLMNLLTKYLSDPQVSVAANDDYYVEPERCVQFSDFESDNRVDDHLRNTILVGKGGSNLGESYDLVIYGAARKTILDCVEKRGRKGYLFMYADEPFFNVVSKAEVKAVYGDTLQADIPIAQIIKEAKELYNIFIIWPQNGYKEARDQYIKLFGRESVLTLQDPNLICELIGSVVGINEEKISDKEGLEADLVSVGADDKTVKEIMKTVQRKFRKPEADAEVTA